MKQSPIDLNPNSTCQPFNAPPFTKFEFNDMKKDDWGFYYEKNLVRIKCKRDASDCKNINFGTITQVGKEPFEGKEI